MTIFQIQAYHVLTNPMECLQALVDPKLVGLFKRIMRGGQDCALCQTTMNLDPESDDSPGVLGYLHGNFTKEIDVVAVAACVGCTLRLGDEGVARALGQEFVDSCCGGGTVEMVQGGTA